MPIDPVTGGLIVAGANLFGQGVNAAQQGRMNKKTMKFQKEMMNQQREWALQDWNMMNEYNHPSAVRARLRAAGINENLALAGSSFAEAGTVRNVDSPSWNPRPAQFDLGTVAGAGLGAYYDTQIKEATLNNMEVQRTVAEMEAMLKASQTMSTLTGIDKTKQDIEITGALKETTLAAAQANVNKILADTKMTLDENERRAALQAPTLQKAAEEILTMRLTRTKIAAERQHILQQIENLKKDNELKELDLRLKREGIQPGDPLYMRMLSQWLNKPRSFGYQYGDPNAGGSMHEDIIRDSRDSADFQRRWREYRRKNTKR